MQINPKLIKNQFEKSLNKYNENAAVQKLMAEKLVTETAKIKREFDNILELGSGAGMLTNEASKTFKFKKYFANDLVEKSQNYVKNIISDATFYCGNAQKIKPSVKMDLIISNAMFQWFKTIDADNYKNLLNSNGILAFSSFSPENFKEIRERNKKFVCYKEGAVLYSMGMSKFQELAKEAKAIYKVNQMVLVNIEILDKYLEKFHVSEDDFYK